MASRPLLQEAVCGRRSAASCVQRPRAWQQQAGKSFVLDRWGSAGWSSPEHDPEKWVPVFGKDHAPPKGRVSKVRIISTATGGTVPRAMLRDARAALGLPRMRSVEENGLSSLIPSPRPKRLQSEWMQMVGTVSPPSLPGLTRQSIFFAKRSCDADGPACQARG